MNLINLLLIIIGSIILFIILVIGLDYIPKRYYLNIDLTKGFAISLVISSGIIAFIIDKRSDMYLRKKDYIELIINNFDKIDDFLINNYDDNSNIIKLLYQNVQLPSSDINLKTLFKNMSTDEKDILFIMYNKITYNLEKMFLLDPKLFENSNLGMRVRLYIDSIYYYEFWHITQNLFKIDFVNFMNNKYDFLTYDNSIYNKPNANKNRYSVIGDNNFIYNSPKYSTSW
jgi:hypothetical protein